MRDVLNKILHHRAFVPASVGAVSVSFGLGAGYALGSWITAKRHREIWARYMAEEDERMRQMTLPFDDPEVPSLNVRRARLAAERAGHPSAQEPLPPEYPVTITTDETPQKVVLPHKPDRTPAVTNVFRVADETWNQETEEAARSEDEVYILSKDEFFRHDREGQGYLQDQLIYYVGDDILTDAGDVPQYDHTRMVGELKFGHGSGEDNVVYVRNPMLKMEWEITRDPGTYEHEVLSDPGDAGLDPTEPPKFRVEGLE